MYTVSRITEDGRAPSISGDGWRRPCTTARFPAPDRVEPLPRADAVAVEQWLTTGPAAQDSAAEDRAAVPVPVGLIRNIMASGRGVAAARLRVMEASEVPSREEVESAIRYLREVFNAPAEEATTSARPPTPNADALFEFLDFVQGTAILHSSGAMHVGFKQPDVVMHCPNGQVDVHLGTFWVTLLFRHARAGIEVYGARVVPLEGTWYDQRHAEYVHPHVSVDGSVCLGAEFPTAASRAVRQGQWRRMWRDFRRMFTHYNHQSPYTPLVSWHNRTCCSSCGAELASEIPSQHPVHRGYICEDCNVGEGWTQEDLDSGAAMVCRQCGVVHEVGAQRGDGCTACTVTIDREFHIPLDRVYAAAEDWTSARASMPDSGHEVDRLLVDGHLVRAHVRTLLILHHSYPDVLRAAGISQIAVPPEEEARIRHAVQPARPENYVSYDVAERIAAGQHDPGQDTPRRSEGTPSATQCLETILGYPFLYQLLAEACPIPGFWPQPFYMETP